MGNIVNEAIFRGRIASMRGTEGGGTIVLACPVITTTRKGGQLENGVRTNFPALSFNKHTVTEDIMKNFKVGNHVVVKGYVQSYLRMDERTGEVREMMEVYIREMLHDNSKMANAFGIEGRNYPECQNEVYLSAPLIGITKRTDSILSLRLDLSGERKNMVNATFFRAPAGVADGLSIGSQVNLLAMVQTIDTKSGKKAPSYQDLVVLDLAPASVVQE